MEKRNIEEAFHSDVSSIELWVLIVALVLRV
jgi:hypothetical protein